VVPHALKEKDSSQIYGNPALLSIIYVLSLICLIMPPFSRVFHFAFDRCLLAHLPQLASAHSHGARDHDVVVDLLSRGARRRSLARKFST
jgi:hypothetical protein